MKAVDMKSYFNAEEVAAMTGWPLQKARKIIFEARKQLIEAGILTREYPLGIIPANALDRIRAGKDVVPVAPSGQILRFRPR